MPRVTKPKKAPPSLRLVVLSFDAAWERTGWSISLDTGPLAYGDSVPQGDWRLAKMARLVRELRALTTEYAILHDADPILAVERCGTHYSWQPHKRGEGDKRGADPTRVVRGLSEAVGAVGVLGVWPGWRYPWLEEPNDWRSWWNLRGGTRERVKRAALATVGMHWPSVGRVLQARKDEGDVAEAILFGVGAARRSSLAPKGPSREIGPLAVDWSTP